MTDPFAAFAADPATAAAVTAARTVAGLGRGLYAPLVVVGPRGSGKSRLLHAIRERVRATPGRQAELLSVASLAELMHTRGVGEGATALRRRLLGADVLLIDEFEAVVRHLAVQALVFDLLESRFAAGRDAVVASAMPVDRLPALDARLRRRLDLGTTVTLGLPGPEARQVILQQRIAEAGVAVDPGVAAAIAARQFRTVGEYLGALNRVLAFQEAAGAPIPPADALLLLGVEPVRATEPGPPATEAAAAAAPDTEFDAFLSEVVANVSEQFDEWRTRLREAIAHWQGRGMRTRRLEDLLAGELGGDPEPAIAGFGRDAAELERLAAEARVLAPDLAGAAALRDPDQLGAARDLVDEARARRAPLSAPLAELTLESLGVGASNRQALEAVRSVLDAPGERDNPLVLVGASGLGKTHLLHAAGNALLARGRAPVACLSAHSFLGEVAGLGSPEEAALWRARYQWVAAFALDDVHVLAGESRAQEELLQIFAGLAAGGRPLLFTSARRLSDLEGFDSRLLTRLEAGLVVELLPPDREVRLAVVKAVLAARGGPDDVALADFLAGRPADSVRAVQGAVQRVLSEARVQGVAATPALAREVLDVVERRGPRSPRRPPARRGSGIVSPGPGVARSPEKMILRWPDPAERLLLELR
jgi:chromosomal replication initiation ATPase DnaA